MENPSFKATTLTDEVPPGAYQRYIALAVRTLNLVRFARNRAMIARLDPTFMPEESRNLQSTRYHKRRIFSHLEDNEEVFKNPFFKDARPVMIEHKEDYEGLEIVTSTIYIGKNMLSGHAETYPITSRVTSGILLMARGNKLKSVLGLDRESIYLTQGLLLKPETFPNHIVIAADDDVVFPGASIYLDKYA